MNRKNVALLLIFCLITINQANSSEHNHEHGSSCSGNHKVTEDKHKHDEKHNDEHAEDKHEDHDGHDHSKEKNKDSHDGHDHGEEESSALTLPPNNARS